ncbi:MAG: cell envelope integrity protein TolA [Nitrospirae bacterium]|nr:cell envelope integrity protein TolA [Nitrospirota bacterium]
MREPSLSRITVTSAVLHLIFATLVLIPIASNRNSFHRPYFVTLTGPFEKQAGKASIETKSPVKAATPPSVTTKNTKSTSTETAKVSKEIERLQAINTLKKFSKLREKTRGVQVLSASAGHRDERATQEAKGSPAPPDAKLEDNYYSLITEKIWQQWVYPESGKSNLETIVTIRIGVDGKIISRRIEKPSGDPLFDRSVMNAISKSSPLPPPPREIEIGVRFHL